MLKNVEHEYIKEYKECHNLRIYLTQKNKQITIKKRIFLKIGPHMKKCQSQPPLYNNLHLKYYTDMSHNQS